MPPESSESRLRSAKHQAPNTQGDVSPMTSEEVGQAVIDIITDIVPDEDCSDLDPAAELREQLDLDSMDFLDIVMELRKKYGVEVPEDDYPRLATLNSCIEYLAPKLANA